MTGLEEHRLGSHAYLTPNQKLFICKKFFFLYVSFWIFSVAVSSASLVLASSLSSLLIIPYTIIFLCDIAIFVSRSFGQFSSVQSLSRVQLFATPWIAARQASLSITNSLSLLKLMPIESVMPSSHLILCRPLLLLPPNPSQHQGLFQWVNSSREVAKVLEFQLQHQSFQWTLRTDLLGAI